MTRSKFHCADRRVPKNTNNWDLPRDSQAQCSRDLLVPAPLVPSGRQPSPNSVVSVRVQPDSNRVYGGAPELVSPTRVPESSISWALSAYSVLIFANEALQPIYADVCSLKKGKIYQRICVVALWRFDGAYEDLGYSFHGRFRCRAPFGDPDSAKSRLWYAVSMSAGSLRYLLRLTGH
jgi:hypothetical protein